MWKQIIKEDSAIVRIHWSACRLCYPYFRKLLFPSTQGGDQLHFLWFNIYPNLVVSSKLISSSPVPSICHPPFLSLNLLQILYVPSSLFCALVPSLQSWCSSCRAQQCSYVITALWSLSITFFCPDATPCVWTLWGPVNPSPWHLSGSPRTDF